MFLFLFATGLIIDIIICMKEPFNPEQFIDEITPKDEAGPYDKNKSPEKKERFIKFYTKLIEKVIEWAKSEGLEISTMKKLGGGFVNAVILVETVNGKSVVVKAFAEEEGAINNKRAKSVIDTISDSDEAMFSEIVGWLDDTTVVSEKVEGESVRKKMERLSHNEISQEEACGYFRTLGGLIGSLHERTEQDAEAYDESLAIYDRERIKNYLNKYVSNPIDVPVSVDHLFEIIDRNITPDYVSYIHGDAHVDQFFCSPEEDLITIVDYDSMRHGDPMADVARLVSSVRAWSKVINLKEDVEHELIKSLIGGYRSTRIEGHNSEDSEFDYLKVVCYEIRLYLVEMEQFESLREKIKNEVINSDNYSFSNEKEFYDQVSLNVSILDSDDFSNFSDEEKKKIKHMCDVMGRINECISYLISLEK